MRQSAALSPATQNVIRPEFGVKYEVEVFSWERSILTLVSDSPLSAGYNAELKNNIVVVL